jgi:3-oxoacyl-[acyl-carrier-protein] synthase II
VGILIGSGMGGLTVFQDGVKNLVEKGYKKMSPFFIPYAITNMCARPSLFKALLLMLGV